MLRININKMQKIQYIFSQDFYMDNFEKKL